MNVFLQNWSGAARIKKMGIVLFCFFQHDTEHKYEIWQLCLLSYLRWQFIVTTLKIRLKTLKSTTWPFKLCECTISQIQTNNGMHRTLLRKSRCSSTRTFLLLGSPHVLFNIVEEACIPAKHLITKRKHKSLCSFPHTTQWELEKQNSRKRDFPYAGVFQPLRQFQYLYTDAFTPWPKSITHTF